MADLAKLVLDVDTAGLRKASDALKDMDSKAKQAAGTVDSTTGRMSSKFSMLAKVGIGAAIGAIAGLATGFIALGIQSINLADDISKAAQQIGIGTEELSRLRYAADLSGVSFEQLQTSVRRLSRNMYDASQGIGQGADAFRSLGVSVVDTDGQLRSATDVMGDMADRFANMEDGAEKTALAMQVFGRAGATLIPMLNGGRDGLRELTEEASRFGVVITEETGRKAEQFNDNLTRLRGVFGSLATQIASELLPYLIQFTNWLVANQDEIRKVAVAIADFASTAARAFGSVANWVRNNIELLRNMYNAARAVINPLGTLRGMFGGGSGGGGSSGQSPFTGAMSGGLSMARNLIGSLSLARTGFGEVEDAAISAGTNSGAAISSGITAPLAAANDNASELQSVLDRIFPRQARERQYAEDLALVGDNARAAAALLAEYNRERGLDRPDISGLDLGLPETFALGADELTSAMGRLLGRTTDTTQRIATSFREMANDTLSSLQRMTDAIKGGGFLNILQSVIGLGLQLGGFGAFGSSIQARINGPVGSGAPAINNLPSFAGGGYTGSGARSGGMDGQGGFLAMMHPNETVTDHRGGGGRMNVVVTMDPSTGALGAFVRNQAGQVVSQAAPTIAEAGAQTGQARMARSNSRRWA